MKRNDIFCPHIFSLSVLKIIVYGYLNDSKSLIVNYSGICNFVSEIKSRKTI